MQILPAILPKSYGELLEKLEKVKDFENLIQIDLVDGIVGEEKTWMPNFEENLSDFSDHYFQFDLMIQNWEDAVTLLADTMRIHSLVFHIDSFTDEEILSASSWCDERNIGCGFSITNDTPSEVLSTAVFSVREKNQKVFVQIMGIRTIGVQGQLFDKECIARVRKIRELFDDVFIQVDGAMRPETASEVRDAGANAVVVGSYIFGKEEISTPLEAMSLV